MSSQYAAALEANHCTTHTELVFRFAMWARTLRDLPKPECIAERFSVSRATAYRWRNAWCDANGLPIPADREPMKDRFPQRNTSPNRRQPVRQQHNDL